MRFSRNFVAPLVATSLIFVSRTHARDEHPDNAAAPTTAPAVHTDAESIQADRAIQMLADGNARYALQSPARANQDQKRRVDTSANGQHPFAAVLSCADSRAPVELIFDCGIGDLFVVRVAGNVADVDEIGSLEYGVEHLGINAILVMGHTKCGAVTAVVEREHVTPSIEKLVDNIAPAADVARKTYPQLSGARLIEKAIRANVYQSIADLTARSDLLRERVKSGKLKIVGAVYDLKSGEVDWLDPAGAINAGPAQAAPPDANHESASEHPAPAAHSNEHSSTDDARRESQVASKSPETTKLTPAQKPPHDNFLALAGLLAGASAMSCGVFYLMRGIGGATPYAPPRTSGAKA